MNSLVALVTGGSRGIGRAICIAFGAQGHTVVPVGRDANALAETTRLVGKAGGVDSAGVTCDMHDGAAIEEMVRTVIARHGRIDILVNNAGGGTSARPMTSDETPDADWLDTLDLNLTSVFRTCKAVTPHMKSRRSGVIVSVASIASRQPSNLSGIAYTAAKSGLAGLNRHLAKELGPFGIRVNAVAPGIIRARTGEVRHLYRGRARCDQCAHSAGPYRHGRGSRIRRRISRVPCRLVRARRAHRYQRRHVHGVARVTRGARRENTDS